MTHHARSPRKEGKKLWTDDADSHHVVMTLLIPEDQHIRMDFAIFDTHVPLHEGLVAAREYVLNCPLAE
jgi:hypothetical protein